MRQYVYTLSCGKSSLTAFPWWLFFNIFIKCKHCCGYFVSVFDVAGPRITFFTSRLISWNKSNYSGVICSLNKELVGQTVCSLNCIESTVLGWEHSTVWGISAEWDNEREVVTTHFVNGLQENLWWKFRCESGSPNLLISKVTKAKWPPVKAG